MMKTKTLLIAIAAATVITAGSTHAASISVPDYTLVPDGTNFGNDGGNQSTELQITDIKALNGGSGVLPTSSINTVYMISTFNWGENSDAHFFLNFGVSVAGGLFQVDRLGVALDDEGQIFSFGDNTNTIDFDLNQDMAGESVTVLMKLEYDSNHNIEFGQANGSDDTVMNFWINPTASSVEGSGLTAGDFSTIWNSANFDLLKQRIDNQSTPATAGDSSITDTVILTGTDATFSNALLSAGVPEPGSLALLGLGGLLVARRRRG